MTDSDPTPARYEDHARARREAGDFGDAAAYYSAAAHGSIMEFRPAPSFVEDDDRPFPDPGRLAWGVRAVLLAALCYRLAETPARAANRSELGILVVEDTRDNEPIFERVQHQGWCHEAIGDLRLFGGLDDHDAAYAAAERRYEGTDNPIQWQAEDEFEFLVQPLLRLADSVGHEIPEDTREKIRRRSLIDRIEYKREHYGDVVAAVLEAGNWDAELL